MSSNDPPFFELFQVLMQECIFLVEFLQGCQLNPSPLRGWSLYIYWLLAKIIFTFLFDVLLLTFSQWFNIRLYGAIVRSFRFFVDKVFYFSSGVEGCVVESYNKRLLSIMDTYASGLAEFFQEVYYYLCVNWTVNSHHALNIDIRNCCFKAHWELINSHTYLSFFPLSSPSIEIALAGIHFKFVNINYFCTHFF